MDECEELTHKILDRYDIDHLKIPRPEKGKFPDFKVWNSEVTSYWEVKSLNENEEGKRIIRGQHGGLYNVNSDAFIEQSKKAAKQFKEYGVTDYPCVIVIIDKRDFATKDINFCNYIKGHILGPAEYFEISPGKQKEITRKPGLFTNRHRYVSAVIIINSFTKNELILHLPKTTNPLIGSSILASFTRQEHVVETENGLIWKRI